jgi:hypothetical protein
MPAQVNAIAEALRRKGADLERMTLTRAEHLHIEDRVPPVNDRVVVFEDRAACPEAIEERHVAHGPMPDKVAAQHWLTVEWPLPELEKSLPEAFPRSKRPYGRFGEAEPLYVGGQLAGD